MGLGYAENDWILREVQERSSLAFRYAIDHSPLTTWRLVKPGGAGGGLETSKSRPNERKNIFSPKWLTTVQQKKREKKSGARLSHEWEKGEVNGHIKRGGAGAASSDCKWVFLHHDAWHPIFPPRHKHVDSTLSLSCQFLYMVCFSLPWPASPVWPTSDSLKLKNRPNFTGLK